MIAGGCHIRSIVINIFEGKGCMQWESNFDKFPVFGENHFTEPEGLDVDFKMNCSLFSGDNLQVMRLLAMGNLVGKVNLCYIDPPYNTGNSFIYNDRRLGNRKKLFGTHSEWMNFIYPRLKLIHSLLRNDGVIAISIDDYEQPYLRLILDDIFGESNFIGNIVTCRSKNGKGGRANIASNHEYIVVYGKSKEAKLIGLPDSDDSYNKVDQYGKFKIDGLFRKKGEASLREDRPNMFYPLFYDEEGNVFTENNSNNLIEVFPLDSKGVERRWLWGKEKATAESWKLFASKKGIIYVKNYSRLDKRTKVRTLWTESSYLTERATNEIKEIYGEKVFETPKPLRLIEDIINSHAENDAIILDAFAGTGTTAHAAFNLNRLDNGSRKVILIEQGSEITEDHISHKLGFRKISDITEARLDYVKKIDPKYLYSTKKIFENKNLNHIKSRMHNLESRSLDG